MRKRSLVSLFVALIILVLGYVVPQYLLPGYTLGPSVALSTYSALLQAFAALFTIVGMFLVFKVERLDAEIAATNSALRARLKSVLDMAVGGGPRGVHPTLDVSPTQINPFRVIAEVADAIAHRDEEPPLNTRPFSPAWDAYMKREIMMHVADELLEDTVRLLLLHTQREMILNRAKWPLSLVAITAIITALLVPASEGAHAYPRIELALVIIVSLFAVWAFTEVFLFTLQILYKTGVSEEEISMRVTNAVKATVDEIRSRKKEEAPASRRNGEPGLNVKSTD